MWAVGSPSVTMMICLFGPGAAQDAAGELQAGVDVGEVLGHELRRLIEIDPQADPRIVHAHRLGGRAGAAAR